MRKQNGITLIAITLTVIVMLIIASITVYYGTDLIQNAKLQDLKTNMLLIQAKTKSGVEEVNFQSQNINDGSSLEQIKSANLIGQKLEGSGEPYNQAQQTGKITGDISQYYYLELVFLVLLILFLLFLSFYIVLYYSSNANISVKV